jgi:protein gp37
MNRTSIEWCDFTANPLKFRDAAGKVVWGCVHASPGCQHCYAETLAKRYGRGGPFNLPTMKGLTPFLDDGELRKMLTYKPASGKRCFVGDMTDVFGEWVPDALLDRLFAVFAQRRDVTWQVLTKRADRMREYCSRLPNRGCNYSLSIAGFGSTSVLWGHMDLQPWPLPNVWLGVSVEDQDRLARIDALKDTPAAVCFVSFEPLLEDFGAVLLDGIQWAIIGGESGAGARTCSVDWIRSLVRQCQGASVPVFVKQLGSKPLDWSMAQPTGNFRTDPESGKRQLQVAQPLLRDRKGGNPAEWPQDLRIREFPR